ncbi:MAG: Uma2 family endonuclease [Spirochaetales bacterium]|nr:Uma2 family endonuclease [Spirochaetales bacterium]
MGLPENDRVFTYGDYCLWPESERWELIDGVAFDMSPAPSRQHQSILTEIMGQIYNLLSEVPCEVYCAPFDVRFPDYTEQKDFEISTVVQPDLVVVCDNEKLDDKGCAGAPDLVVEILSPSTMSKDLHQKFSLYEKHGVKEYWVISPGDKVLFRYKLSAEGKYLEPEIYGKSDVLNSDIIVNFKIELKRVFK